MSGSHPLPLTPEPSRRGRVVAGSIAALSCAVFVFQAFEMWRVFGGCAVDDAYISFRYADNLLHGLGLTWNAGQRVEGYSNFLWVVLLALFGFVTNDLTLPSEVLGVLFGCATLLTAILGLRRTFGVTSPVALASCGLLIATSGYFTAWSVSGLESALHAFALVLCFLYFPLQSGGSRGPALVGVGAFVVLAMVRPEGLLIAGTAIAAHLVLGRVGNPRVPLGARLFFPAAVATPLLAYHTFRVLYYGPHLWPNSVRAKVGTTPHQVIRGLHYVFTEFLFPYAPLLLAGLVVVFARGGARMRGLVGGALFYGGLVFVGAVGGDWSHGRFFAPLIPLGAILFVAAIELGAEAIRQRVAVNHARSVSLIAHGAVFAFVIAAWNVTAVRELEFRLKYAGKDHERIAIGRWLAQEAPKKTVVAVFAAGAIPYYSRLPSHDMLGLNDLHIVNVAVPQFGRGFAGHERFDVNYTLDTIGPEVIVDPQLIPGMLEHPTLRQQYIREEAFIRNLVLVKRGTKLASPLVNR